MAQTLSYSTVEDGTKLPLHLELNGDAEEEQYGKTDFGQEEAYETFQQKQWPVSSYFTFYFFHLLVFIF